MEKQQDWSEYVQYTAKLMDLNLREEYVSEVIDNFVAIAKTASLVMEFSIPEEIEIAPIFKP